MTQEISTQETGLYWSKDSFEHIQRVANFFCKSDMVPKRYQNNVGNCIVALEIAHRMGASPLMVMQNLDVIQGKPGWSSVFLIATLNASGKFSPIRYEEDEIDGGRTRAWAYDLKNNEKVYGAWVSMNMAKSEGWIDKSGSKWKTMPEVMRRYRAASFFTKQFAPEVSMGLQTIEEVIDITPIQTAQPNNVEHEVKRFNALAESATDLPTLESYYMACSDELKVLLEDDVNKHRERITNALHIVQVSESNEGGEQ